MSRKKVTLTDLLNQTTYKSIYEKFKLIAINRFEWVNLPFGIEEKYIEHELFKNGKAIFFRDPKMSYMCLRADEGSKQNVYGEPLNWWATGFGYHEKYKVDDCVIIDNNKLRIPTEDFIIYYANKMYEAERTMDTNVKTCKLPFVFKCDEKSEMTLKNIYQRLDNNEPALFIDKGLGKTDFDVFTTNVSFMGNDLQDYKHSVENELLTFLGVNNVNVDKKERLITDEAEANDELINSFCSIQLASRQKACEEINKMYNLNISVKLREEKEVEKGETGNDDE